MLKYSLQQVINILRFEANATLGVSRLFPAFLLIQKGLSLFGVGEWVGGVVVLVG
jgi:hypothetical protein